MNEQNRPGNFFTIHCRTVSVTGKGEGTVDYAGKAREFISDSTEEIRRLEREIDRIREIVVRLERYLDEADRLGNLEPPTPRNPPPLPSFLGSQRLGEPSTLSRSAHGAFEE